MFKLTHLHSDLCPTTCPGLTCEVKIHKHVSCMKQNSQVDSSALRTVSSRWTLWLSVRSVLSYELSFLQAEGGLSPSIYCQL